MSVLMQAVETLNKRKVAANENAMEQLTDLKDMRMIFAGTDLDYKETHELAMMYAHSAVMATISDGTDVRGTIAGMWIDGLITGILLADLRAKEDTPSES